MFQGVDHDFDFFLVENLPLLCLSKGVNRRNSQNPNHNSTLPTPNITLVGLDVKMTVHTTPTPTTTETQCYQYLSCYRPDFDENLNLGSWEHLEQWMCHGLKQSN